MKILFYGGAFNPIHRAHLKIMECACEQLNLAKLIIIPNKEVHFKNNDNVAAFNQRVAMIELALKHTTINCAIEISAYEQKQTGKTYTFDLISMFRRAYPTAKFYFLIGSDHVARLKDWYRIEQLKKEVNFVVAKRKPDFTSSEYMVLDNAVMALSSTVIRDSYQSTGLEAVDAYIRYYGLYLNDVLKHYLNTSRIVHSNNVAALAKQYAPRYQIDENKAYVAGMVHDIAKDLPLKKQYDLVKNDLVFECNDATVHAYSGVHIVRDVLGIKDEDILEAIKWHTTAYFKMSPLAKLIYCCDMLSAERSYPEVEMLRLLLPQDLNECFKQCFKASYHFLVAKKTTTSPELKQLLHKIERNEV